MNDIAIRVENLSKQYFIGRKQESYKTLRDTLSDAFVSPFRKARKLLRGQATGAAELDESIWALKDVSFEVKRGDVIGIIGRNGAGKSTLLKILSRITEPTTGHAEIRGRVGSLLEVGTGFHPELSGRENVFLNGTILGMRRAEIEKKFDEIVAFAEVEKFIDTPVKHYSSGMYLRLAFAVAAHLETEIMIVDEVLAVGDARFQKKCVDKMEDVGKKGRAVLFVSHNMPAITRLCDRTLLLDQGHIVVDGPTNQVVGVYLRTDNSTTAERIWPNLDQAPGSDVVRLRATRVRTVNDQITDVVDIRQPVKLEMEFEVLQPGHILMPNFNLFNENGVWVFNTLDHDPEWRGRPRPSGHYRSTAWIPGNFLAEGTFFVCAPMMLPNPCFPHFFERDVLVFQVVDSTDGDSARGDWAGDMGGVVRPLLKWSTQFSGETNNATAERKR